jgi:diacylglycerol kinase (ATP)
VVPSPPEVAVLANPTANRGRHRDLLPAVVQRLRAGGCAVRVLDAPTRAAALDVARAAVRDRPAGLVAVGGDGTVHVGLQAVAGTPVPFGVIPAGTGNDFAADLGLPVEPLAAADAIATAACARRTRSVDLARVTGADGESLWYGGVLAAGFDTLVNERANRMPFPRGPRRYDMAIVLELLRLRTREYTITLDGETHRLPAVLVAVGNTPSYGGRMRICPDADPTDGLLDVVVGGAMSRATLMRIKPRLYTGTHIQPPLVQQFRARTVGLAADGITTYADGERAIALPVTITVVPGALCLLG